MVRVFPFLDILNAFAGIFPFFQGIFPNILGMCLLKAFVDRYRQKLQVSHQQVLFLHVQLTVAGSSASVIALSNRALITVKSGMLAEKLELLKEGQLYNY